MANPRQRGRDWERTAERYLRKRGLRTVSRNYAIRSGEIDLVMLDGASLVFVEVRYRARATHGTGAESVTAAKQARIISAAGAFLASKRRYALRPCRFDVVSIGRDGERVVIDWIRGAFDASRGSHRSNTA